MLSFKMSRFYSLLRSETIQKSWIFLQNSDKNKLWMLHYLLYIIIQKGIPAMGCLDAVLEMRVLWRERVGGWRGFWERLHGGFCYRELLFTLSSSYCCVFCRAEWYKTASRQKKQKTKQKPALGRVSPWGRSTDFVVSDGGIGALCFWRITVRVPELERVLWEMRETDTGTSARRAATLKHQFCTVIMDCFAC